MLIAKPSLLAIVELISVLPLDEIVPVEIKFLEMIVYN